MESSFVQRQIEEVLNLKNPKIVVDCIVYFLREEVKKAGFEKVVVGLSGGVDSSLTAFLSVMALGKENVIGISMPYKSSSSDSVEDAKLVAETLSIEFHVVDITPQIDAYLERFELDRVRLGNKLARERMSILYDFAHFKKGLVVGTSNKTELLVGYSTRWGDGAYDINPIGDLYKTQVWQIAQFVGVPEKIVKKTPTADLWAGQTDEGELGIDYHTLDKILCAYVELRLRKEEIVRAGFPEDKVDRVLKLVKTSQFKRKPSPICKLSPRTVDKDFLYLRDWGT